MGAVRQGLCHYGEKGYATTVRRTILLRHKGVGGYRSTLDSQPSVAHQPSSRLLVLLLLSDLHALAS
eukprot:1491844-Rhodomonas_salina.2